MVSNNPELNAAGKLKSHIRVTKSAELIDQAIRNMTGLRDFMSNASEINSLNLILGTRQEVEIIRTTVDDTQVPPMYIQEKGIVISPMGHIAYSRSEGRSGLPIYVKTQDLTNTPEAADRVRLMLTPPKTEG